jgi:hypothetical protein
VNHQLFQPTFLIKKEAIANMSLVILLQTGDANEFSSAAAN